MLNLLLVWYDIHCKQAQACDTASIVAAKSNRPTVDDINSIRLPRHLADLQRGRLIGGRKRSFFLGRIPHREMFLGMREYRRTIGRLPRPPYTSNMHLPSHSARRLWAIILKVIN